MKRGRMLFLAAAVFAVAAMAGGRLLPCVRAAQEGVTVGQILEVAEALIEWKKEDMGSTADGFLINDAFLQLAGTTPGDWYPIGLGRLGVEDNQSGYLAVIEDCVQKRYDDPSGAKLDAAKATEWHRISLAILACGGNPRAVGEDRDGDGRKDLDLIADGTYDRVDENGNGIVGRQGINGFIWALITLDSRFYEVPEGGFYSRDDLILNLLSRQLKDGGWALTGTTSDPDITAMTIQALAPYYNSEKEYLCAGEAGTVSGKKVRSAVDEALAWLSENQLADGDFFSWGMPNCESTVQVIVALTSLGINIFEDPRFIKTGADGLPNTLYDGLLKYRTESGGFTHSFVNDAENPSAVAGQPNSMAGEQALYGLAAIVRSLNGDRRLYDFREEQSAALRAQIEEAEALIASLDPASSGEAIRSAYDAYLSIDAAERSYVSNYAALSALLSAAGIPYEEEEIDYNSGDAGVTIPTEYFDYTDQAAAKNLPRPLTTASRTEVLRLWNKLGNSVDFEGKAEFVIILEKAKNEIEAIQAEIDAIKAEIKAGLYPFDGVGLSKRAMVYDLYERYLALSEYDRAQFEPSDIEGLLKSKTQVDNLLTACIVGICCAAAAAGIACFVILRVRKRRLRRAANAMPESDE